MNLKSKIIEAYRNGNDLKYISKSLNIPHKELSELLINLKESNRHKRTFTDEFKKIIAERDMSGVSRRKISTELKINASTVKKACEQFGQPLKEKVDKDRVYERIDGEFDMSECPSCSSIKVNEVDDNTIYCKKCGDEHIFKKDHILKINWEYLE